MLTPAGSGKKILHFSRSERTYLWKNDLYLIFLAINGKVVKLTPRSMRVYKLRNVETGYPHLLLPGEHLLGRSDEADILVDCISISRRHARIFNQEEGVFVEDLGSQNGTWVDEAYLEPSVATNIAVGETIYFGGIPMRLDPEILSQVPAETPRKPAVSTERLRRPTEKVDLSSIKHPQPKNDPIPTAAAVTATPAAASAPVPVNAPVPGLAPATPTVITKYAPTFRQKANYLLAGLGIGLVIGLILGCLF